MTTTLFTVILRYAYTLTAASIAASQITRLESNQLLPAVDRSGFEPLTPAMRTQCSTSLS